MIDILLTGLFILIQGLFTAAETAAISIEKSRLGRELKSGRVWAKRTRRLLDQPDRFFSAVLVWEDFLLVLATTVFTHYCIKRWGSSSAAGAVIILTFVSFFVSQYTPKIFALNYPTLILKWFSLPVLLASRMAAPAVALYAGISRNLAKLFLRPVKIDTIRRADIAHALDEYEKESSLMVSRLFNFSRRTIAEVMIPLQFVHTCRRGNEIDALRWKKTRLPVMADQNRIPIGIFNTKDYFFTGIFRLKKPFFVNADQRCMPVFLEMKKKSEHMAIVLNADKSAVGIVTIEDLIEELVGEIREEK